MKAKNRPIGWLWLFAAGCVVLAVGLAAGHMLLADNQLERPKHAAPLWNAPESTQSWRCPAHVEDRLSGPGKCPKCGMDLTFPKPDEAEARDCAAR